MRHLALLSVVLGCSLWFGCNAGSLGGRRRDAGAFAVDAGPGSPRGGDGGTTALAPIAPCELDEECAAGQICIGRCIPDPAVPVPCTGTVELECPGNVCVDGWCGCTEDLDCLDGLSCIEGRCDRPDDGCLTDDECGTRVCIAGTCVDRAECEVDDPDLTGTWEMSSELNLREALPDWLSRFLDAVEMPFRYLAGEVTCSELGLSRALEILVCPLLDDARDRLPPWGRSLLGSIADLNVLLATWHVNEEMTLAPRGTEGEYDGTRRWTRVRFMSRTSMLEVDPRTLVDWRFMPEPFVANASCGTLHVARHDIDFSVGAVIVWLVNTVIYEASDHRYGDLRSGADALAGTFCAALGDLARDRDPLLGAAAEAWCEDEIDDLIARAVAAIEEARLEVSPLDLRGRATIEGARSLRPGVWDGRLLGGSFSGSWEAWR